MGSVHNKLLTAIKQNWAATKDTHYIDFKSLYFIKYNCILSIVAAIGSFVWIFRDIYVGMSDNSPVWVFRLIPLAICGVSVVSLIKRKYKLSWWLTFATIWATILGNFAMYLFTRYNEGSIGEGWIVYYLFFFALSISSTSQIRMYLSNIIYTAMLILSSTEYGGYIVYTVPIIKTIVTSIIIILGLWLPGMMIRQVFYKLYEADKNIRNAFKVDTQTSLFNRKKLDDILYKKEFFKGLTTVIILDLDGLKKINDTYGYYEADDVLSFCASSISKCIRPMDTLIRYEGDEFLIVLDGIINPAHIFETIQNSINTSDNKYGVTLSGGSFQCIEDLRASSAIRKAYIALRVSKQRGKNCITSFKSVLDNDYDTTEGIDMEYLKAIEEAEHIKM